MLVWFRAESKSLTKRAGIPHGVLGRELADICWERELGSQSKDPVLMTGLDDDCSWQSVNWCIDQVGCAHPLHVSWPSLKGALDIPKKGGIVYNNAGSPLT